jgi:hypothetical protein
MNGSRSRSRRTGTKSTNQRLQKTVNGTRSPRVAVHRSAGRLIWMLLAFVRYGHNGRVNNELAQSTAEIGSLGGLGGDSTLSPDASIHVESFATS